MANASNLGMENILRDVHDAAAQSLRVITTIDPAGLATQANQEEQITEAILTNTKLDTISFNVDQSRLLLTDIESWTNSLNGKVPSGLTVVANRLEVDGSGVTQPISAVSLPLPTGAATAANQATEITTLGNIFTDTSNISTLSSSINSNLVSVLNEVTSIDGKTPALGQTTMVGSSPVVIASDQSTLSVEQIPVYIRESTALIDTSVTNIPASGGNPLEVIAATTATTLRIQSVEDIGEFIGVYQGAALSETLVGVLPLGGGEIQVNVTSGTRISLRNMKNTAISTGFIVLNLIG